MATEQQPYDVIRTEPTFEVRRYPAHVVAEVTIAAAFDDAGNRAFRYLFGYISGANRSSTKLAMTAPVVQQSGGAADEYRVAFVLPADTAAAGAPEPSDPAVRLVTVPGSVTAAARFSGRWTASGYQTHLAELRRDLEAAGLVARGAPRFARFDAPYVPAFLRRNEVLLDLEPDGVEPDSTETDGS